MPPGLYNRSYGGRDRRTTDHTNHLHGHDVLGMANKLLALDPFRGGALEQLVLGVTPGLQSGVIAYSLPHAHWYLVNFDGGRSQIRCTSADMASHGSFGIRRGGSLPARSHVVVWVAPGKTYGFILGCYPVANQDPGLVMPDWLSQGSQAGIKREDAYKLPFKNFWKQGGILDFSANRPLDSLSGEWSLIAETGTAFLLDAWQAFLRVNEACGLFLNYFDSHTRLAGVQLDLQTAVHEMIARLDEGENRLVTAECTYPWEALGLYAPGTQLHNVFPDDDVQYRIAKGSYDLPDGEDDTQTIARWQEHGCYLGQGKLRTLMVPNPLAGEKRYYHTPAVSNPDLGVFRESVALDGSYLLESAKQLKFVKRVLIPVAKEMVLPEDQKAGDDARLNNYKFSGVFGSGGVEHKVGDVKLNGDNKHLLGMAGIDDLVSYSANWQALHPFHYHAKDYQLPEESNLPNAGGPSRVQDNLDFGQLAGQMCMDYPSPTPVKVDGRYGSVDYFQREAGIAMLPDGGIMIYDGYGAAIVLTAGNIRFECPGTIYNMPGRSAVTLAGRDIVQRANRSVDITAGTNDVRIKAEKNLMLLGGNQNQGGILIESKGPGFAADFNGKTGEDVVMGGVMIKSPQAGVVVWGGNLYFRTGGGGSAPGQIVMDASQGASSFLVNAATADFFVTDSLNCWVSSNGVATATYNFTLASTVISTEIICGGPAVFEGQVVVQGEVAATGGFASGAGTEVGELKDSYVAPVFASVDKDIAAEEAAGNTLYQDIFTAGLYAANQPGNDTVIKQTEFNYRDDPDGRQYGVPDFQLPESRWQMMARLAAGTGGSGWSEPAVSYQGEDQLPWPGNSNWTSATLLELPASTLYDPAAGRSRDRGSNGQGDSSLYENPQVQAFANAVPATDFKVIAD